MSKLQQIQSITQEARELVEEFEKELNENIQEFNATLAEFKSLKDAIALSHLEEMKEALSEIKNIPQIASTPIIECEDKERIVKEIEPLEPFEIKEPRSGTFGAKFWGVLTALIVFFGFGAVGAYFKKLNFDPNMIDLKFFEQAYGFYSDLFTGTSGAAPALGIAFSVLVAFIFGYLVYYLKMHAAASSNLERAKALFESAKEYVKQQQPLLAKVRNLKESLKKAIFAIKGSKLFADEMSAKVERIKFFEGDDFNNYVQNSKRDIEDLLILNDKLIAVVHTEIFAEDEDLAREVKQFFDEIKEVVEKIKGRVYGG
ncbi:hypothetical protein [Nitratiruptor tergarcus]|uniref:Uncharacterized protein n=1 Tax=Nitratiruptor tergarcus DSM 16512 TaxID=1069081 RepID=A0A1W1WQZ7_9BACT|nr:hypothetical protein [Nitratiruptor tergarcus]SMC08666.1 hypothetical protein SAMN05660197_0430 [Nitratiruptor tergarcus DSM 16512]